MITTTPAPSTATDYRDAIEAPLANGQSCDFCGEPAITTIVSDRICPETGYQDVASFCRACAEERLS